jgi:hypothetical protein
MSIKYLGESFDLHTGGVDNIFPGCACCLPARSPPVAGPDPDDSLFDPFEAGGFNGSVQQDVLEVLLDGDHPQRTQFFGSLSSG